MAELSPTAQAVLEATHGAHEVNWVVAAALRAVVEHCPCDDGHGYWIYRPNILAIADEIESSAN